MAYTIQTLAQRPDLRPQLSRLNDLSWPEFMFHDAVADQHWGALLAEFADFQFFVCDETGAALALGQTIPIVWDGTLADLPAGWDAALAQGIAGHSAGHPPTTLCALAAVVPPTAQGRGVSKHVLQAMKTSAAAHGLDALIAPVRPSLKHRYPLTPIERYAAWVNDDGLPFDPWLRVHRKLGAEFLGIAPRSMVIDGTLADWESWADMRFPESGAYIVPRALAPIEIAVERDHGRYVEPNVWMRHHIS